MRIFISHKRRPRHAKATIRRGARSIKNSSDTVPFNRALFATGGFVLALWLIKSFEWWTGTELTAFGIYPRDPQGLRGIVFAPLIHGSFEHLIANTPALLVLGASAIYGYPRASRLIIPTIYVGSGLGVWLFAREIYHIGASGLSFGLMFFVFAIGVLRRDRRASALSMIVFFLYGGMIWGIFPGRPGISFEYHFFGAAIGVIGAIVLRRFDPPPPEKKYSWELEDENDDDPYWLDGSGDDDQPGR